MPLKISAANRQRAARIKLFLCDVDGVLTDSQNPSSLALLRQRS
jgi:ribonucleotide monophosphatase NagD (HAD superfamily)